MNNKKYEILMDKENTIEWNGHTLHRIRALKDFGEVNKGDLGGFVENKNNLSHYGNCWIYDDAKAMDNSRIYDNSRMYDNSEMHDNSVMCDYSKMYDESKMYNNSKMYNKSRMRGDSRMHGDSRMFDNSAMYNNSEMYNKSRMHGYSIMFDYSRMFDNSAMYDNSVMYNNSELKNNDKLYSKLVSRVDAFIEISNPEGRLVTCVKKGNKILYNIGCQDEIDEETFKYRIEHEDGGLEQNPHRKFYYKIIEASKILLLNK